MANLQDVKNTIVETIKLTEYGNRKFYQVKQIMGKNPIPDATYPELISIEVSSICNLSCVHCPPQMKVFAEQTRKHSYIDYDLFNRLMDEIDQYGKRHIALHKDGEPLIHPRIQEILKRMKKNVQHTVYITTNAQNLKQELIDTILENKVDVVNFSIGANSEEFYSKVRGKGFNKVINNIHAFLSSMSKSKWTPKVIVQIIDLPEYPEMNREIKEFKKYWNSYNVQISVWKKLTWGVLNGNERFQYRYPCYSLWHSFNINSNGVVTACCMDWRQELDIGNVNDRQIKEIWDGTQLKELRQKHVNNEADSINACSRCNYWKWQPMLMEYF